MKQALAIFGKEPVPGEVKTRLVPPFSFETAAELYRCMLTDTLSKCLRLTHIDSHFFLSASNVPASDWYCPPGLCRHNQHGLDLGERMNNAFMYLFSLGYERVVIIGTDSPDLPSSYITSSFKLLSGHDVVIGPCDDGGYYLIGTTRPRPGLFQGISWSSAEVLAQTLARAAESGISVHLLPEWQDLDTVSDLERLMKAGENTYDLQTRAFLSRLYLADIAV